MPKTAVALILALALGLLALRFRRSPAATPTAPPFVLIPGIRLTVTEVLDRSGLTRHFELVHAADGDTARFRFSYEPKVPDRGSPFTISHGTIASVPGSQPGALLAALAEAHGGDPMLAVSDRRVAQVALDVGLLGQQLQRRAGNHVIAGEFTDDDIGPWIVTKLFIPGRTADDEPGEIFLAMNTATGEAEFVVKDPEYWPLLAPRLAEIL